MKAIKILNCVLFLFVIGAVSNAFAQTHHQFDVKLFDKIAKRTIGAVISGDVDADALLADMEKLLDIGIAGCKEHMGESETPENEKKLMKLTIDNGKKMTTLSLDEIESQWHDGGAPKAAGIDIDKWDHFDEVMCHYDAVVHPATCIICINTYKKTKNEEMLDQIKDELSEVREHLKHLE